ncbi:hypothetical protein C5167_003431 [Papaver somniferum]|uniref:F-box domain-containing protein n=1 Tax=Papaver somniferum TaxID=3469 RepID=A0A4Y7L232_PAPSO|nr:hypothetical protein C5167_003431 [Papaver somniferum]
MSSTLPQDMIIDILTRLPVTSISRFKCVCKSWLDLFDDIQFRKLHYDRINIQKKSNLIKIIAGKRNDLYSIDVYDSGKVSEVVKIVDYPFYNEKYRESDDNLGILGSYNGLVCIRPRFDLICFWYPSTKDYRIVSKVQQTETPSSWCRFGFSYDLKTLDYKLVSFESFMDERRGSQIMVYSLASNSWSTTPYNMPYTLACRARPISLYFNGALHWLTDDSKVLVSFDLGDRGDVWVMEEYGVRESWTKRFTVPQRTINFVYFRPIDYLLNGEQILLSVRSQNTCSNVLVCYNPKSKRAKILKTHDSDPEWFFAYTYEESLFSVRPKQSSVVGIRHYLGDEQVEQEPLLKHDHKRRKLVN